MSPSYRPPPRVGASQFPPPARVEEISRRGHSRSSWQSPSRQHRSKYESYSSRHRGESSQRSGHYVNSSAVQVSDIFSRRRNRSLSNGNDSKKPEVSVAVSDKGRSVEFQGRDYGTQTFYLLNSRWYIYKKLENHAYKKHLSGIMRDIPHERGDRDSKFQHLKSDALLALAWWILGREKVSVFDIVRYVNENGIVPEQSTLFQCLSTSIELDWRQPPDDFKLYPINSPAVLIHWRVLLNLLPSLTSAQREGFRKIGTSYKIPLLPESESKTDEETSEDSPKVRLAVSVQKIETLDAYDSHVHLDRLARRLNVPQCIQQVMTRPEDPSAGQPVSVKGGTMVFCDPNTYSDAKNVPSIDGWATAVAYHPRHTTQFDVQTKVKLEKLMMSDAVMAYGEIGLDRTERCLSIMRDCQ